MSDTLNPTDLSLSTASNTRNSSSFINEKDFPQFMNFLQSHPQWPGFNSQIFKVETKQPWMMTIKREPIAIAYDRPLEEEKAQEPQNDQKQTENLQESQFSVDLSVQYDVNLLGGELIYNFAQQLQALTYRQLLEDEKSYQLPALLSAKKFLAHFQISIKPRNDQILDCLAIEMNNPVSVTKFTYNQPEFIVSDFEYVSKAISSFPTLKNLTLKLNFVKDKREDSDFSSLIQSISQLKQLKDLDLRFVYQLNYRRLNFFFQAISQLSQLSYLKITIYNCNLSQMDQLFNIIGLNNLQKLSILSLNFSYNRMSNEGANSLLKELSKLTNSISCLSLIMNQCDLNDQSAAYLGQAISQLKQLSQLELYLAINKITSRGMQQILEAINNNPSSLISDLCLNLNENSYKNEGVISIASSLKGFPRSITKLKIFLPTKGIEVSGVEALSEALLSLVNLIYLNIIFDSDENDYNDIHDEQEYQDSPEKQAFLGFFQRIRQLTNLRSFFLWNNYLPSKDLIKKSIMKKLPGLVKLN